MPARRSIRFQFLVCRTSLIYALRDLLLCRHDSCVINIVMALVVGGCTLCQNQKMNHYIVFTNVAVRFLLVLYSFIFLGILKINGCSSKECKNKVRI